MQQYNSIIIGAGIGGLAIGSLLAKRGMKVAVLEKQPIVGGRAASVNYQGHMLDSGPHYIGAMDTGGLNWLLNAVKAKVEFVDTPKGLIYKDGNHAFMTLGGLRKLVTKRELYTIYSMMDDVREMSDKDIEKLDDVSIEDFLAKRTRSQTLFEIYRCSVLLSHTMDDLSMASAGEFIRHQRAYLNSRRPLTYPREGGIRAIAEALSDAIKGYGGEVLRGEEAVKIKVNGDKVTGVVTSSFPMGKSREFDAPIIISNLPIQDIFRIVDKDRFPQEFVGRIKSLEDEVTSGFGVIVGLNSPLFTHSGPILVHKYTEHIRYLVSPTNITTTISPKGKHYLFYGYYLFSYDRGDVETTEKGSKALIKELCDMFPEAENKIEWVTTGSVRVIDSLAKKPKLTGRYKPDVEAPIEGLFFVGDSIRGGGSGINAVISSARICEQRILARSKEGFKWREASRWEKLKAWIEEKEEVKN
jgi:prolycopene isomerase